MIEVNRTQEERALRLHKEAIIVDTHCDSIGLEYLSKGRTPGRNFGVRGETGQVDLPRLIEGGVTCQVFALSALRDRYSGYSRGPIVPEVMLKGLKQVDKFYSDMANCAGFKTVTTVDEIIQAKKNGLVTGMLSMEGAELLMGEIALLRVFYMLGIRIISFTWNYRTPFADGLGAKRSKSKLPELGVHALEEMDKLGIVFDVSHLCDTNFWDVCDLMKGPFIASHSNCRDLCHVPRNLTDDMIWALADHEGVIGVEFVGSAVAKVNPNLEKLVDHVDHIVDLVGPDHVGLGSDFDGGGKLPELNDTSQFPNVTRELVKRNYSDKDILKILGGNHMRVFKTVFK